jgi:hypothetical protein
MYLLRDTDKGIELHRYRPAHEIGFSGRIGPLPTVMCEQVRGWRSLERDRYEGEVAERVTIGTTLRDELPVLVMSSVPEHRIGEPTRSGTLIFRSGPTLASDDFRQRLDGHTDPADWGRKVIGVARLDAAFMGVWVATQVSLKTGALTGHDFDDFVTELRRREAGVTQAGPGATMSADHVERGRLAQAALIEAGLEPNGSLIGGDEIEFLEPDVSGPMPGDDGRTAGCVYCWRRARGLGRDVECETHGAAWVYGELRPGYVARPEAVLVATVGAPEHLRDAQDELAVRMVRVRGVRMDPDDVPSPAEL